MIGFNFDSLWYAVFFGHKYYRRVEFQQNEKFRQILSVPFKCIFNHCYYVFCYSALCYINILSSLTGSFCVSCILFVKQSACLCDRSNNTLYNSNVLFRFL